MTDYSGLVERLREPMSTWDLGNGPFKCFDPRCTEAAAAIEAQCERIERLEGALTALVDDCPDCEGEGGWPEVPRIDTNDPLLPAVACRRCAPARAALGASA